MVWIFGKWDFAKETSNYSDYEKVDCNVKGEKITCDGEPINTDEGVWGDEQLSRIIIFDENGIINEHGGEFCGVDRFEARKLIVEELERLVF